MSFVDQDVLWNLFWILPLFALILFWGRRARRAVAARIFRDPRIFEKFSSLSHGKRFFRACLLAGTLLFLVVSAARLAWGRDLMPESGRGRDLMFLFDVSRSMLADDVKPSRLEHAKWLVRQLVKDNPGDRFGLIVFAGDAFLECPLTIDRASFEQVVNSLNTDTVPLGGTNVQIALEQAVKAFEGAEGTHKAVLLITDGDELTGRGASVVSDLAKNRIPIFAAGIGDPANPALIRVPDEQGNLKLLTDSSGNTVKSPLNEPQLIELARKTGGIYVRSTTADPGIAELEARIRSLDRKAVNGSAGMLRPIERPVYPLLAAFLLFLVWLTTSERKTRSAAGMLFAPLILPAILSAAFPADASAKDNPIPHGQTPVQAVEAVKPAETAKPESPSDLFNRGVKAQRDEAKPDEAARLYERAIASSARNPEVRASAYQNLGVISHAAAREKIAAAQKDLEAQKLDESEKAVEESLKIMNTAEDNYRESMRSAAASDALVRNQQMLQDERRFSEELKKKIEELKKMREQAQKDAKKALDQQKQKQQEQKQQEQKQQEQKQQEQKQENQTNQAKQSAQKLEQQAKDLKQKNLQESARQAKEELQKAEENQKQGKEKEAEKNLENAVKALGKPDDRKQQDRKQQEKQEQQKSGDREDEKKEQQKSGDREDEKKQEQPKLEQQQGGRAEEEKEPKDMDKKQAEALLDVMSGDEKDLRDKLRERRRGLMPQRQVEKDW